MNSQKSQTILTLGREDWNKLCEAIEGYNRQYGKWPKLRFSREREEVTIRLGEDRENAVTWIISHDRTSK
jgi:extradiol dioxygenase family protein